jgi:3'-phosphoadenosine 5'-phosphosulfate (PAPS) 3'-phosphatase
MKEQIETMNTNTIEGSYDNLATTNTTTIHLPTLATHCIYSTLLASNTIQAMARTIPKPHSCNDKNTKISQSRIKEDGSIVTDADGAAQRIIYNEIYKFCKEIKITGEESELEMDQYHLEQHVDKETFSSIENINEFQVIQQELNMHYDTHQDRTGQDIHDSSEVDCSRVCVFVDPLDGTSSYAKGEYDAVTILIAIILDNVPIFGVIGKPFVNLNDTHGDKKDDDCQPWRDTGCSIIYGGSLIQGVYYLGGGELKRSVEWRAKQVQRQIQEETILHSRDETDLHRRNRRAIISKSKMIGCVNRCIESLSSKDLIHSEPIYISGAGMKTMKLVIGSNNESLWFFPKPGTSLWDVAAADALLRVMGGKISDGCGNDLDYSKGRLEGENMQGIIACIDSSLHATCLELCHDENWYEVEE